MGFLTNYVHFTKCLHDRKDKQNARQTLPNIVLRVKGTPCDASTEWIGSHFPAVSFV